MSAPTATCELYVDDVRVADTGPLLIAGAPTALSGLKITWGRDGQNEQPGAASCSFDIVDEYGGENVLDKLHVGSKIDVWSEGKIPGADAGWAETVDDPTLSSWPLGDAVASYYVGQPQPTIYSASVIDRADGRSVQLGNITTAQNLTTNGIFGPRRFSPPDTLPDAWDDIAQYDPTQDDWRITISARAPIGASISFNGGVMPSPYSASFSQSIGSDRVAATGEWQTITAPFRASMTGWVGFRASASNVRWRWRDQPADSTWAQQTDTWQTINQVLIDNVSIQRPTAAITTRRVLSFSGEVTDVTVTPEDVDGIMISATSMDIGSQLGNTVVGDDPWPVQTVAVRADRIAQLAGVASIPRVRIDDALKTLQLSYRDVDAQPAYQLLQDVAQSAGGVLWAATHALTGPYLWIENPASRESVRELVLSGGTITITGAAASTLVSSCDVLLDPVAIKQDSADVVTVVAVTWLEQGTDDEGQITTTERTVTVTDSAALATYGTRRLSISTELISQSDAQSMADRLLAQARAVYWRLDGVTLDTETMEDDLDSIDDASREIALLNLLDGTSRMGLAFSLIDLPLWLPGGTVSSLYVEGGTYSFENGFWKLALTTTPAVSQADSTSWSELPAAWQWQQWDPALRWVDLYGVSVEGS